MHGRAVRRSSATRIVDPAIEAMTRAFAESGKALVDVASYARSTDGVLPPPELKKAAEEYVRYWNQ